MKSVYLSQEIFIKNMKKFILLLALLSPSIARANTVTPQWSQGSMQSTTNTTQTITETRNTKVYGSEINTWSGTNVTPSGDITDSSTTFSVTDNTQAWQLETTTRAAGLVEEIDSVININTTATTTSLSVFSQ
tara:strand:- start:158 stop:556 length:399 start_codon:yes stop_codon:yes gene_type:complete